jgi:hypothetical protein
MYVRGGGKQGTEDCMCVLLLLLAIIFMDMDRKLKKDTELRYATLRYATVYYRMYIPYINRSFVGSLSRKSISSEAFSLT